MKLKSEKLLAGVMTACAATAVSCQPAEAKPHKSSKPNMIVILVDDYGYGDLGAFRKLYDGRPTDPIQAAACTPNMDRLAEEGIRFTRAYTCPWSAPARQMLLTGMWTNRESAYDQPWIGKRLRDQGYTTALVGKSHGQRVSDRIINRCSPEKAEFSDGFFFNGGCRLAYLKDGEKFKGRNDFEPFEYTTHKGEHMTYLLEEQAEAFIRRQEKSKDPFFLYLAHTSPHEPLQGYPQDLKELFPEKYGQMTDMEIIDSWVRNRENPYHYSAMVYGIDKTVGSLVKTLEETGKLDNTIIVFASDNGQHRGSSYPLHGHKWELYEGGIRTPLFVWSKNIQQSHLSGSVYDGLVSLADITPTLTAIAGEPAGTWYSDGEDMREYIRTGKEKKDKIFFYSGYGRPHFLDGYADFHDGRPADNQQLRQMVYVKGKEKVIAYQSWDGKTYHGATYLDSDGMKWEGKAPYPAEQPVVTYRYPQQERGEQLYREMIGYIRAAEGDLLIQWSGEKPLHEWQFPLAYPDNK